MVAIVTGAAGFAGFSLTERLLNTGYKVYAIVRPNSQHNTRLEKIRGELCVIECDCEDYKNLKDNIKEKCDVFYHLAWFGARDDFETQFKNITYALDALEVANAVGCKRFVGIGSQAEYGVCQSIITENTDTNPTNAYGTAKVAAMYLTKCRARQLGIEWIWGRIFSLYGKYEAFGRMLPDTIQKMRSNESVNMSSCEQNWDYLNVTDAARAIIALGERGYDGEVYNIANGDYKELKQFVEFIRTITESKSEVVYGARANPFVSLQPSVAKITEHTGWQPEIGFEDGIRNFIKENY